MAAMLETLQVQEMQKYKRKASRPPPIFMQAYEQDPSEKLGLFSGLLSDLISNRC
jgi:hypothetical protein